MDYIIYKSSLPWHNLIHGSIHPCISDEYGFKCDEGDTNLKQNCRRLIDDTMRNRNKAVKIFLRIALHYFM